jgi:ATP-dependent Clp protease ATP-binding subunit ClpA
VPVKTNGSSEPSGAASTTTIWELLSKRGFDPLLGARPLRRTIQRDIEDVLAEKILFDLDTHILVGQAIFQLPHHEVDNP